MEKGDVVMHITDKGYSVWWSKPRSAKPDEVHGNKVATFDATVPDYVVQTFALAFAGSINARYVGRSRA